MIPGFLVQTTTQDKLILSGFLTEGDKSKPANIMVHGFEGDFYTRKFLKQNIESLSKNGYACISIMTRGTGVHTVISREGLDSITLGSYNEKIEESHLDINAWIQFLKDQGYTSFNLIGHSLGTIKVTRYLFEGEFKNLINKLILLAPFDKNGYIIRHSGDNFQERLTNVIEMVKKGKGKDIVPNEYEDYPISYNTYKSWYIQDDLSCMFDFYKGSNYKFPVLNNINIPVKIIVGDKDDFLYMPEYNTLDSVESILRKNIKNLDLSILPGCGHIYLGYENDVSNLVTKFVNE